MRALHELLKCGARAERPRRTIVLLYFFDIKNSDSEILRFESQFSVNSVDYTNSEEIRPVGKKLSSIYSQNEGEYAYRNAYEAS